METKILGLSGKKQSGKNTASNYIVGCWMNALGLVNGPFQVTDKGELYLPDIFGDEENACIFDIMQDSDAMIDFRKQHLDEFIRVYSFADALKQDVCMKVLGLTREQCYGTDEQKNGVTHLRWENMPSVITEKPNYDFIADNIYESHDNKEVMGRLGKYYDKLINGLVYHEPGPMTAREVMQFVGTEVFRRMYNNVWADATIRRIKEDKPLMAIICDVRFINEVECVNNSGGKVLRLNRDVFNGQDQHESETALDNYPVENFFCVMDNNNMTVHEQCVDTDRILTEINWLPKGDNGQG